MKVKILSSVLYDRVPSQSYTEYFQRKGFSCLECEMAINIVFEMKEGSCFSYMSNIERFDIPIMFHNFLVLFLPTTMSTPLFTPSPYSPLISEDYSHFVRPSTPLNNFSKYRITP